MHFPISGLAVISAQPFFGAVLGCHLIVIFLRQKQRWFSNVCYLLLWMFFYAFNPSSLS
ncbi:hypothetical protein O59_000662 [Cellvibrio sp. BR]|nr:hypothetical protein O59_000662 [Cellvibrio sp. BR]